MKKTDIVILVSQKYVKEPYVDDTVLKYLLEKKGCKTEIVAWDNCSCYEIIQELLKNGDVIVQQYHESIETLGEKSIVVIDGKITYAMLKKPKNNGFLVHLHHGGTYIPDIIKKDETAFVEKVQNTFDEQPAYMRIDRT